MQGEQIRLIDLFAGAGGFTLGLTQYFGDNIQTVWANDFNLNAAATYNANFGNHCVVGDIVDILEGGNCRIPQADIVIGGPPCQGFSLLNKKRRDDPRKQLWIPFMDIVDISGARVFENGIWLAHSNKELRSPGFAGWNLSFRTRSPKSRPRPQHT